MRCRWPEIVNRKKLLIRTKQFNHVAAADAINGIREGHQDSKKDKFTQVD